MIPHLIHVGYAKTGSTFLRKWFDAHPQIAYSEGGIAGFRDVYDIVSRSAGPASQVRLRVTSSESLCSPRPASRGAVVDYAQLRNVDPIAAMSRACTLLRELFPNAVVLIVTRGLRSMIVSSYSQYVRSSGELDLEAFVEEAARGQPWDYDRSIACYAQAFGESNLIVLPYELLRDDAAAFTGQLEERFGLAQQSMSIAEVNPALSAAELYWYPRLTRLIGRLAPGPAIRQAVVRVCVAAMMRNNPSRVVRRLQRLRPGREVTVDLISDAMLEPFRGKAERLRENPLYASYLREYLLSPAPTSAVGGAGR